MKFPLILFYFIICSVSSYSQQIDISNKDESLKNIKNSYRVKNSYMSPEPPHRYVWTLLDSSTNERNLKFLATIKITEKKKSDGFYLTRLDGNLNTFAQKLGANLLRLKNFSYDKTSKLFYITLDAFLAPDSILSRIKNQKPKNVLDLFPYWQTEKDITRYYVNGKTVKIGYRQYLKYDLKEYEAVRVYKSLIDYMDLIDWGVNERSTYIIAIGWGPTTGDYYLSEGFGELLTKTIFNNPIYLGR